MGMDCPDREWFELSYSSFSNCITFGAVSENGPQPKFLSDIGQLARRFIVILVLGFWLGGFTFYASVVIHTGHRVFGGQREVGFLTQEVTRWLNVSAVIALAVLLWNVLAEARGANCWIATALGFTWIVMLAIQVVLFRLHPALDRLLQADTQAILDRSAFHHLHKLYMNLSTAQWSAGLLHILLMFWLWRMGDSSRRRVITGTHQADLVR